MRRLSFTVPGEARGKGRPRATSRHGFTRLYTDDKTAAYENLVALCARQALAGEKPLAGALTMAVGIRLCPPASTSKKKRAEMLGGLILPTRKPDLDNCVKAVMDGCNHVAFADDVQVISLVATKWYAEEPGVDVELAEVGVVLRDRPVGVLVHQLPE